MLPRLPPCAIALADIATDSIDFTRRDSRDELPILQANKPITPAGTARARQREGTDMHRYPSIGNHGLIDDLQTRALVTTDGTVDWFCCPRFDSPSVFASMATPGSIFTCRRH
jgi:Domain of unknown function (DUF5911)